MKFFSVILK